MKKIAITQRLILNKNYYELREALDVNWGLLFKELDFLPIVLPIKYDFENYFEEIQIDGILLTGGNDLNTFQTNKESYKRDDFENKLIKYAIANNIPIFGVCRGLQIIAEFFGANFRQVKDQVGIRHKLEINRESQYFNLLNKINNVNSFHTYAIDNLPDNLLVSATNEFGIIKAIEHKKYKIFAQMWHTERDDNFDKHQLNLLRNFYNC